jgi:hypothetical protein
MKSNLLALSLYVLTLGFSNATARENTHNSTPSSGRARNIIQRLVPDEALHTGGQNFNRPNQDFMAAFTTTTVAESLTTDELTAPVAPTCRLPTREEIQIVLDSIRRDPRFIWLTMSGTVWPCQLNGCFLRKVALTKILQDIFKFYGWCWETLCDASWVSAPGGQWPYHTVPACYVGEGPLPYDPSGQTSCPLSDFWVIETYGPQFLECVPGDEWGTPNSGQGTCALPFRPEPDGPPWQPPAPGTCQVFVHAPNCSLLGESIDELLTRLRLWCQCARAVGNVCMQQCWRGVADDTYRNCIQGCQRDQTNYYCAHHTGGSGSQPPPQPPAEECANLGGWGDPGVSGCGDHCERAARAAQQSCIDRGGSSQVCGNVYVNALKHCTDICVRCVSDVF